MSVLFITDRRDEAVAALSAAGLGAKSTVETRLDRAASLIASGRWDLVILDAGMSEGDPLALVRPVAASGTAVVVTASQPTLAVTLRALNAGALDVIAFPPSPQRLAELLGDLGGEARRDRETGEAGGWIGSSPALLDAFRSAVRLGYSDAPVLMVGEPGSGRKRLARVIHESGTRAAGPWLVVNCGAIPEAVLESELFGHERGGVPGVFGRRIGRFAKAAGGTVYLAELERLSLRLQQRLANMLATGRVKPRGGDEVEVDVRLIAGVESGPVQLERQKVLLPALHVLLAPGVVELPPLRVRGEPDIRLLVEHFLQELGEKAKKPRAIVSDEAWAVLLTHPWPGNVRQLRSALERGALHAESGVIHVRHLPRDVVDTVERQATEQSLLLDDVEKRHILRVLELAENHVGRAAEMMGIHRNTLTRKLRGYGVEIDRE